MINQKKCLAVRSDFMTDQMKNKIIKNYNKSLISADLIIEDRTAEDTEFFFILGGGTENQVYRRYQKNKDLRFCYLIAHDENNSLPASLELLAALQNMGVRGKILFLHKENAAENGKILREVLENHKVMEALKNTRIGMLGDPSDWLVASSPSVGLVKEVWGASLIEIPIEKLVDLGDLEASEAEIEKLKSGSKEVIEPNDKEMAEAIKVYKRMEQLVKEYKLNSVTVKCFTLLEKTGITGCLALSQLNDRRILAGCEGDPISILTMQWIYYLTDSLPWMGNPSSINSCNNSMILAHCTVPKSLILEHEIRSHFESGMSVAIAGEMVSGAVTLIRIGGNRLEKIWCVEGRITENLKNPNHCRTQVQIDLSSNFSVEDLLIQPLGNHLIMVYGHHTDRIIDWWKMYIGQA